MIANSMRRDRFEEIFKYIHAADNYYLDSKYEYAKLRPFNDIMNDRFLNFGSPFGPTNISIDESMVPYYGRQPTKHFIRVEPIRWGYRAWVASKPLGYAYHINMH